MMWMTALTELKTFTKESGVSDEMWMDCHHSHIFFKTMPFNVPVANPGELEFAVCQWRSRPRSAHGSSPKSTEEHFEIWLFIEMEARSVLFCVCPFSLT
jgi:hypothetical protein